MSEPAAPAPNASGSKLRRRALLGLVFGGLFLGLAFWGVPLEDLRGALSQVQPLYLIPIALIFMIQQSLRAWRQMILLRAIAPEATWWRSMAVLCIAFFCINTLPARIGEFVRPYLFLEKEGVPLGAGFGIVFAERVIDLIAVLILFTLVLATADMPAESIEAWGREWPLVELGRLAALGVLPPLVGVTVGLALFGEPAARALERIVEVVCRVVPWGPIRALADLGLGIARTFSQGLEAFRRPKLLAQILALTAVTWTFSGWMYVLLAQSLGIGDYVGYIEGIGVMVITMLGTIVPAPPGMAGVHEAFGRGALALFGVRGEGLDPLALAFALTIHWWQYLVQSSTAVFFFFTEKVSFTTLAGYARGAAEGRGA